MHHQIACLQVRIKRLGSLHGRLLVRAGLRSFPAEHFRIRDEVQVIELPPLGKRHLHELGFMRFRGALLRLDLYPLLI